MIMAPLLMALAFVVLTTLADVLGAWLVVQKLYRPSLLRVLTHFAVGTLLGFTFLDLLPEALEVGSVRTTLLTTLLGIVALYIFEHLTASYHCTDEKCQIHNGNSRSRQAVVLLGASLEEFIDGAAIGLAVMLGSGSLFLVTLTSVAIFLHEVPDSMARTVAFINAGVARNRAIRNVLFSALASLLGATLAVALSSIFAQLLPYFTALAAAAFIYIALSHLMPELHRGVHRRVRGTEVVALIGGVVVITLLSLIE